MLRNMLPPYKMLIARKTFRLLIQEWLLQVLWSRKKVEPVVMAYRLMRRPRAGPDRFSGASSFISIITATVIWSGNEKI